MRCWQAEGRFWSSFAVLSAGRARRALDYRPGAIRYPWRPAVLVQSDCRELELRMRRAGGWTEVRTRLAAVQWIAWGVSSEPSATADAGASAPHRQGDYCDPAVRMVADDAERAGRGAAGPCFPVAPEQASGEQRPRPFPAWARSIRCRKFPSNRRRLLLSFTHHAPDVGSYYRFRITCRPRRA